MYRQLLIGILIFVCCSVITTATTIKYNVTRGIDDYDVSYNEDDPTLIHIYESTTIKAMYNYQFSPYAYTYSIILINTSLIPDNHEIQSANLSFYIHDYTSTSRPATAKTYDIWISIPGYPTNKFVTDALYTSANWYTHEIPSNLFNNISKTDRTQILIKPTYLAPPGPLEIARYRYMEIRAYEYTGDFSAYLNITLGPYIVIHSPPNDTTTYNAEIIVNFTPYFNQETVLCNITNQHDEFLNKYNLNITSNEANLTTLVYWEGLYNITITCWTNSTPNLIANNTIYNLFRPGGLPPACGVWHHSGDWVIDEPTVCSDENIDLDRFNLIINSNLTFNRVNLSVDFIVARIGITTPNGGFYLNDSIIRYKDSVW